MNAKRFQLSLIFGLVMLVPLAWAESFPNRQTPAELEVILDLGTECINGVNERCYATQYATNPVRYRVDPPFVKTNSAIGWNLNTNRLGQLASTARTLVRWYADPATVYDRSPNISMLTVTGVWAQLGIGDRNSNFTATAASGTNAATYRDYPLRVYRSHLVERYKVLNALEKTYRSTALDWFFGSAWETPLARVEGQQGYAGDYYGSYTTTTWAAAQASALYHYSEEPPHVFILWPGWYSVGGIISANRYNAELMHTRFRFHYQAITEQLFHRAINYLHVYNYLNTTLAYRMSNAVFDDKGYGLTINAFNEIGIIDWTTNGEARASNWFGTADWPAAPLPWCDEPTLLSPDDYIDVGDAHRNVHAEARGLSFDGIGQVLDWQFNYCIIPLW